MVNFDGQVECSEIVAIEGPALEWSVFPNPAYGVVEVLLPKGASLEVAFQLFSVDGRLVRTWRSGSPVLDLSALESGVYYVKTKGCLRTLRLVLLK